MKPTRDKAVEEKYLRFGADTERRSNREKERGGGELSSHNARRDKMGNEGGVGRKKDLSISLQSNAFLPVSNLLKLLPAWEPTATNGLCSELSRQHVQSSCG